MVELAGDLLAQSRGDLVGAAVAHLEEWPPARDRQRIAPREGKALTGKVQFRQRLADGGAVLGARPAHPHPREKGDERRRPAGKAA